MQENVTLVRETKNKLNDQKLQDAIDFVLNKVATNRALGVSANVTNQEGPESTSTGYRYSFCIVLDKKNFRSEKTAITALGKAKEVVVKAGDKLGWVLKGEDSTPEAKEIIDAFRPKFSVGELHRDIIRSYFSDVYERDAHIRLIHDGVKNAVETDFEERSHVLLYGPPAAAKTILFQKFKDWYESSDPSIERVAYINATTLSKAGLENWLLQRAQDGILPEILFFDELEKFNPDNLLCLLNLMDGMGTITRINSRIGRQSAKAQSIVWATCNDDSILKNFQRGALWSRFSQSLPCYRPSRELMLNILEKKLEGRKRRGLYVDMRWAKICVDYGYDVMKTNDPRKILALLAGGKRLSDGSYFKDIEDIQKITELRAAMDGV